MPGFDSSFHLVKLMCNRLIPTATILPYGGPADDSAPQGFLTCNGDVVLIADYQCLYNIIGSTYNTGSEDTDIEFRLPDLRGRAPIGVVGNSNITTFGTLITAKSLGDASGSETHTLNLNEIPAHNHTMSGSTTNGSLGITDVSGNHNHGGSTGAEGSASESENVAGGSGATVAGALTHTHSISFDGAHAHHIASNGGGLPHNNMQPYLTVSYIIKT